MSACGNQCNDLQHKVYAINPTHFPLLYRDTKELKPPQPSLPIMALHFIRLSTACMPLSHRITRRTRAWRYPHEKDVRTLCSHDLLLHIDVILPMLYSCRPVHSPAIILRFLLLEKLCAQVWVVKREIGVRRCIGPLLPDVLLRPVLTLLVWEIPSCTLRLLGGNQVFLELAVLIKRGLLRRLNAVKLLANLQGLNPNTFHPVSALSMQLIIWAHKGIFFAQKTEPASSRSHWLHVKAVSLKRKPQQHHAM